MKSRGIPVLQCAAVAAVLAAIGSGSLLAQSTGSFVRPQLRGLDGAEFAFWDWFAKPPGKTYNYQYDNPPALLDGTGEDEGGAQTNLFAPRAVLVQTGSATAFVTSSGAIYDHNGSTAFEARYQRPQGSLLPVTNVVFQTQTGGSRFDIDNIRLVFTRSVQGGGTETVSLAPDFKALDDPQTGSFSERLVSAFQWNLEGAGAGDFKLIFSAPSDSMPLWQAQLDVVLDRPFVRELGFLLLPHVKPVVRFGRPGRILKNLPSGAEERFHLPGQTVELLAEPENGWAHLGWLSGGTITAAPNLPVTFTDHDLSVTALFAPRHYDAWREAVFQHGNPITGEPDDYHNDAVSGPEADPDGDGARNFAEYAFGGDPYLADKPRMTPFCTLTNVADVLYPAVTFRQGTAAEEAETHFRVRVSTDLTVWTDNDSSPVPVTQELGRSLQADGTQLVTVRALQPVGPGTRLFFTVVAE